MAGIGFELEKHFEKDTTFSDTVGYLGAAAVFTGPWAFGTAAIVAVYLQARGTLPPREESLLFALLTFSCCLAMHLTGAFTFVITRYLADRLYSGDSATIGPCYAAAWILHLTASAVIGGAILLTDAIPPTTAVAGLAMIVACTQLWLVGAFITMLRAYGTVALTFAGGYTLAALAGRWLGARYGIDGYLFGFWLGVAGIALTLTGLLLTRLSFPRSIDFGFLAYARQRFTFVTLGLSLAAGTWIDKLIYWYWPGHGLPISNHLSFFPAYDVPAALGALTVLPGLAWLLLAVETGFAQDARHVYTCLRLRGTYDEIHEGKVRVAVNLTRDFWGLMRVQGPITLAVIVFAPDILSALALPQTSAHVLRMTSLAAVGQVLLQAEVLYFLYFDAPGRAAIAAAVFLGLNAAGTLLSLAAGFWTYGLPVLVASWTAAWVGARLLDSKIARLESDVLRLFARHALGVQPKP